MLDSLYIRNFRLFKELSVERLRRVNLIVGKNNSGKSCLLESVRVYVSNGSPAVLYDLISQRDESWEFDIQARDEQIIQEQESALRHLFYGYHLPKIKNDGIEIGPLASTSRLHIRTQAYQIVSTSEGGRRFVPINQREILEQTDSSLVGVGIALEIEENGKSSLLPLTDEPRRRYGVPPLRPYMIEVKENIQAVPAGSMIESQVSLLWDKVNLTDLEEEVVKCLQLIDNRVKGVSLVGGEERTRRRRIPIIRLENSGERFSLKSMGDGMTRLFHIILALVNAKDGVFLIDEFENGLHWSVLPKVWETVFKLADRLNVQVFATTHSHDCIRGFEAAWQENESLGSFHRLDSHPGYGVMATSYELETLADALEMDVEVR